jgi:hypothetical protein
MGTNSGLSGSWMICLPLFGLLYMEDGETHIVDIACEFSTILNRISVFSKKLLSQIMK